jgi:type IV pilus assembly protein PilV
MNRIQHSSGSTLLEVLIAMVVLAVGILGVVSLQAISMKLSSGALLRSQATNLASSVIDAMRVRGSAAYATTDGDTISCNADDGSVDNDDYLPSLGDMPLNCSDPSTVLENVFGSDNALTGTFSAAKDRIMWVYMVACTLPNGRGCISVNGTNIRVSIRWDVSRELTAAEIADGKDTEQQLNVFTRL